MRDSTGRRANLKSSYRHWTTASVEKLRAVFPKYPKAEILKLFPNRSWRAIAIKANQNKIRRLRRLPESKNPPASEMYRVLRAEREYRGISGVRLSRKINASSSVISKCEAGMAVPSLGVLTRWCASLGYEITIKRLASVKAEV